MKGRFHVEPSIQPLFVYGTLRPNFPLHGWISEAVKESKPATLQGFAMHVPSHGAYPVIVRSKGDRVVGDLLLVESGDALYATIQMELHAGYGLERVICTLTETGAHMMCVAFVWPQLEYGFKKVPSGNWANAVSV